MSAFRYLLAQRRLALIICAAALVLKLLVPGGYMIGNEHGRPSIIVCSGVAPPMSMSMGEHGAMSSHGSKTDHSKAEMPCAFVGLATAALGAIDPVQLAALIAFVIGMAQVGILLPAPFRPSHLRPPLRGPPAYA